MINILLAPFKPFFHRIQRSRLRQIMRGYRNLKNAERLDCIAVVKQELTVHKLNLHERHFSSTVMGAGLSSAELIVRQYLLVRIGGLNLNRALLLGSVSENSSVVFPLPCEWRELIENCGFKVARFRSALLWQLYAVAALFYGIARIGRIALTGLKTSNHFQRISQSYVYFSDLGPGNLPHETQGKQSHDVVSWYLQWQGRRQGLQAIHHSVTSSESMLIGGIEIIPTSGPLPALNGLGLVSKFIMWAMSAIFISTIDFIRGRWWHALLLNQAALAAQARIVPKATLAYEYLFHNSSWIYRPLWTYEVEKFGAVIYFYFYSTNCEEFRRGDSYPELPYGWRVMNWPHFLVWDEYQADFVRRAVGDGADILVVGQIWFHGRSSELPRLSKRGVAVFDVTPHRASRYCTLGLPTEFYVPDVTNLFCEHVINALKRHDVLMLWKRKRNVGRIAHPRYRHFADQVATSDHLISINPDITANLVIDSSDAVISIPFTSTALVARALGRPSAYYDPTGKLNKDDRAAHGIPVLQGECELDAWLAFNLSNQIGSSAN